MGGTRAKKKRKENTGAITLLRKNLMNTEGGRGGEMGRQLGGLKEKNKNKNSR